MGQLNYLMLMHKNIRAFPSLSSFRNAHSHLLRRDRQTDARFAFLDDVETFLELGKETGVFLESFDDRWDGQSMLDYWVAILYRAGRRPAAVTLAEFDPLQLNERIDDVEKMCQGLDLEELEIVKRIVLQVVHLDDDQAFYCSRVLQETFYPLGHALEGVVFLLDRLVDVNFLHRTPGKTPEESQIEVAFESLVSRWKRLVGWLDEEREARRKRQPLTDAAQRWADMGCDPDVLCSGKLLIQALDYPDLSELEAEFVRASVIVCLKEGEGYSTELASPQLIRVLIELLSDQSQDVCSRAGYILEYIADEKPDLASSVIDGLIERLTRAVGEACVRTATVLAEVVRIDPKKVTSENIDILVELLRDSDPDVCSQVVYALEWVAVARSGLAEQLAIGTEGLLVDPRDQVRARAAGLLEEIVRANPQTATLSMAETLVERYQDSDDQVRSRGQYALERIVNARPDLVLQIAELLDSLLCNPDRDVRVRAAHTLDEVVRADPETAILERAIKLGGLLRDGDSTESLQAEHLLKRILEARPQLAYQIANLEAGRFSPVFPWYSVSLIRGIPPKDVNSPSLQAGSSGPHYESVLSA